MKPAFELDQHSKQLGLEINLIKTKHMISMRNRVRHREVRDTVKISSMKESLNLSILAHCLMKIMSEFNGRIAAGNRYYYAFQGLL